MQETMGSKTPSVGIERGKIVEAKDGGYKVESYTRGGVTSRFLDPGTVVCATGDEVYFFMFPDGRGMILGKIER